MLSPHPNLRAVCVVFINSCAHCHNFKMAQRMRLHVGSITHVHSYLSAVVEFGHVKMLLLVTDYLLILVKGIFLS